MWMPKDKLEKIAWLYQGKDFSFFSHLQVQKFLFFYEMFQMLENKSYDITGLKAYANGPVFSSVYGDIRHQKTEIINALHSFSWNFLGIDSINAKKSLFLIQSMTDKELSELTHALDMWNVKAPAIQRGEKNISITQEDITQEDIEMLSILKNNTPYQLEKYEIVSMADKKFIFTIEDYKQLTEEHYEVIEQLSREENLINPVYVTVSNGGVLLVD